MKRILLYCQNMLGAGHFVRMSLLARGLAERYEVFLVDGGRPIAGWNPAPGINLVSLPRIRRSHGQTIPCQSSATLADVMTARRRRLESACREIRPDALVVEHFPFGKWFLRDEVLPLTKLVRQLKPRAQVICSVRDLLHIDQETSSPEIRKNRALQTLGSSFDHLLIHSDPPVHTAGTLSSLGIGNPRPLVLHRYRLPA